MTSPIVDADTTECMVIAVGGDFYHPPTAEDERLWALANIGRDEHEAQHALWLSTQPPVGALYGTLTRYPVNRRHR